MKLEQVILRDTRANQPTADGTNIGALYFVTDEEVLERSNGSAWQSYSGAGGGGGVPSGTIVMWSGSIETIPAGWVLCDGENDTPYLLDKFLVCAGNAYTVGASGGNTAHSHVVSANTDPEESSPTEVASGTGTNVSSTGHDHVIETETATADNLPPYFALAFIMKS